MSLFMNLFSKAIEPDYNTLVKQGAMIVDVRTPGEFQGGHIRGSVNIPLDEIRDKAADLKSKNKVIITCCRSGSRSGMAASILEGEGIESYNGGPWDSLEKTIS